MEAKNCGMCANRPGADLVKDDKIKFEALPSSDSDSEARAPAEAKQRALHCKSWSGLIALIEQRELDEVRALFDRVPRKYRQELLEMEDSCGETALHVAARVGQVEMMKLLAEFAPDRTSLLHKKDNSGQIAFHIAAGDGFTEVVRLLAKLLPDELLDVRDMAGQTAMHVAAASGQGEMLEELVNLGPSPRSLMMQKDHDGRSALVAAVKASQIIAVHALIRLATEHDSLQALLEHADGSGRTPLHTATHNGALELCSKEDVAIATILLRANANTENTYAVGGATLLTTAADKGHEAIVLELLDARAFAANSNREGETALTVACRRGHTSIAEHLLQAGACVQHADHTGWNALMHASSVGCAEIVRALVRAGAKLDERGDKGNTALTCAAREGHDNVVRELLEARADVHLTNTNGNTALILACTAGQPRVVRELLRMKADARHSDRHGITAMEVASYKGHAEIVELLTGRA